MVDVLEQNERSRFILLASLGSYIVVWAIRGRKLHSRLPEARTERSPRHNPQWVSQWTPRWRCWCTPAWGRSILCTLKGSHPVKGFTSPFILVSKISKQASSFCKCLSSHNQSSYTTSISMHRNELCKDLFGSPENTHFSFSFLPKLMFETSPQKKRRLSPDTWLGVLSLTWEVSVSFVTSHRDVFPTLCFGTRSLWEVELVNEA